MTVLREIGALAGLAAVLGLAVLSGLYVAHARAVRRLRAWAGHAPERAARPSSRRPSARSVAAAGVAVLVLAGLIAHQLAGDGDGTHAPAERPTHRASAVRPADVTVAVLNATAVPGLAASLRDQLTAAGYRQGAIDDFPGADLTASVVQYAPGHRRQARAVAREMGVGRREPLTAAAQALAAGAPVVVIAGTDQAP